MSEISEARQALRDAARVEVAVFVPPEARSVIGPADVVEEVPVGALAHHAFRAAQAALTVAEELRAEAEQPISTFDRYASMEERTIKNAQREAADRIEAAVLKALS